MVISLRQLNDWDKYKRDKTEQYITIYCEKAGREAGGEFFLDVRGGPTMLGGNSIKKG